MSGTVTFLQKTENLTFENRIKMKLRIRQTNTFPREVYYRQT